MEEILRSIERKLDDLLTLYTLIHSTQIDEEIEGKKVTALSGKTRMSVYRACDGRTSGSEIGKRVGITPQRVSQHIAALAKEGLVTAVEVQGRRYYAKKLERFGG